MVDTRYQKLSNETIDQYKERVKQYYTPQAPQAPQAPAAQPQGSLAAFSDAMNRAVQLARQERNSLSMDFMKPFSGTVAASDFSSILSSMNNATDTYAQDTLSNVLGEEKKGKVYTSGSLQYTDTDIEDGYKMLQTGLDPEGNKIGEPMGQDQFVDPRVYLQMLDVWRAQGPIADFLKKYPLTLINPENEWVGEMLAARGIKWQGTKKEEEVIDFTAQEKRKLEQAGLMNATRQEQLDYLYKPQDENSWQKENLFQEKS